MTEGPQNNSTSTVANEYRDHLINILLDELRRAGAALMEHWRNHPVDIGYCVAEIERQLEDIKSRDLKITTVGTFYDPKSSNSIQFQNLIKSEMERVEATIANKAVYS